MGTLKDAIFAIDDIKRKPVAVPEWGLNVEVRTISGAEADMLDPKSPDYRWQILIACCFDPATGERVWDAADIGALKAKSMAATLGLMNAALEINGWTEGSREELKKDCAPEEAHGSES